MGVVNHNAVIATIEDYPALDSHYAVVIEWISSLTHTEQQLFLVGRGWVNGSRTIVLIPDGSKEGWAESDRGNDLRKRFIERLREDDFEDGSCPWRYVEIGFGEFGQAVLRGNNDNCYDDQAYCHQ